MSSEVTLASREVVDLLGPCVGSHELRPCFLSICVLELRVYASFLRRSRTLQILNTPLRGLEYQDAVRGEFIQELEANTECAWRWDSENV